MFKKVFTLMMLALVAAPSFALADWQIKASTTPAGVTAVPSTTAATANADNVTRVTDLQDPVTFTLGGLPAGYSLTSVTVDGKRVVDVNGAPDLSGSYTLTKGTMINHSIVANYKLFATNTFTIKSIPSAGGSISKSVTVAQNDTPTFTITPYAGFTLTGIKIDGAAPVASNGSYTFAAVSDNHTIQGVFAEVKTLAAVMSIPPSLKRAPGATINVSGNTKP